MNKVVKTIASTTLAFGTLLGVSSAVLPVQDTAHAATQTKGYYYSYNGYVDKDAKFLNTTTLNLMVSNLLKQIAQL